MEVVCVQWHRSCEQGTETQERQSTDSVAQAAEALVLKARQLELQPENLEGNQFLKVVL